MKTMKEKDIPAFVRAVVDLAATYTRLATGDTSLVMAI